MSLFPHSLTNVKNNETLHTRKERFLQEREAGFDNDFGVRSKLPEYNALQDENMKRFFENPRIQQHLWQTGQVSC